MLYYNDVLLSLETAQTYYLHTNHLAIVITLSYEPVYPYY